MYYYLHSLLLIQMQQEQLILCYCRTAAFFSVLIVLILISVLICIPITRVVYGESSLAPFSRQEINSAASNIIQLKGPSHIQTKTTYNQPLDKSASIQRVTYFSDGITLNATLWVGDGIKHDPSIYGVSIVTYGVLVDVDNNLATGKYGVDYQREIQWNNKTRTWNSAMFEYSSPTQFRTFDIRKNYTNFSKEDERYVLLPLNLDSMTSPNKFRVLYYAILIYNNSKTIVDLTSWIDIPPPQFTLLSLPSPIIITQGEQKDVGVQLKSNEEGIPRAVNYSPVQNSNVEVQFNPDRLNASTFGTAPAPFRIKVPSNAQVGHYAIPISLNISRGSTFPSKFINVANFNLPITTQNYITGNANLTISVIEPPTPGQRIKDFWDTYGSPISLVGAGFAGAFSTYIFDYLKFRKQKAK
jgi:hypothetical protein